MTSEVDIANRALGVIGNRSQIASLTENSAEARAANLYIESLRDELLRMAPWNCCRKTAQLSLVCAAPGTPENPTVGTTSWQPGQPAPPWAYEYLYPSDCIRPLWIVPQFTTGFASGVPITTAVTGGAPSFWNGPPARYEVALDQIDAGTGLPSVSGSDAKVILTNQEQAILRYNRRITNPDIMDDQFTSAWYMALGARMVFKLTGDKTLANLAITEANKTIQIARVGDGNEGLTINNIIPDWIRVRGIDGPFDFGWTPNSNFDWGSLLAVYG